MIARSLDIIICSRLAFIYHVTSILQICIKLLYDYTIFVRFIKNDSLKNRQSFV